ncbi:amino acid adenylation domain-containing protein [Streptomyces sp. NPDC013178]|uniref:non-ribosomal peptide synthetase n=1 Tax=Streptomyces sp. NPDC013178 TaxID=3155118 RepID=UPI0033C5ADAD
MTTSPDELAALACALVGAQPGPAWSERARKKSFVELGGDSLSAAELVARAQDRLQLAVDLGELLGLTPLEKVLAAAVPVPATPASSGPADPAADGGLRPALPGQDTMLLTQQYTGGTSLHMILSLEFVGPLKEAALVRALHRVVERHDTLRTVFVPDTGGFKRRVLASWSPPLLRQSVRAPQGADAVETVHHQLGASSHRFITPFGRPPYTFVLSDLGADHTLLSFVHHASMIDGWGLGMLWREITTLYDAYREGRQPEEPAVLSSEAVLERYEQLSAELLSERLDRRVAQLADLPKVLEVSGDPTRPDVFDFAGERLCFELEPAERDACEALAAKAGVTRTVALFCAWALALGRRAGVGELIMATPASRRSTPDVRRTMGLCAALLPVGVRMADTTSVVDFLRDTSRSLAEAVAAMDVPFGDLVVRLGGMPENSRVPLAQVAFSGQHDFIPHRLRTAECEVISHQGHCGGASNDVSLYVLHWDERPRLAMEYATSVLSPLDAADLAESFRAVISELAAHADGSLAAVHGLSEGQRRRLRTLGAGAEVDTEQGLWQLFERAAADHPDLVAVEDSGAGVSLTYAQLLAAATAQSAALAAAGVRTGDHVVLDLPRSVAEVVAVLGTLRLGAAYVSLSSGYPESITRELLGLCAPRAVIGSGERARWLVQAAPEGCAQVAPTLLDETGRPADPGTAGEPAPADPDRVAYLSFTSGSTGLPKAVRAPHRGVVRLATDPDAWLAGPGDRFLRLAPLSFDASTLELFCPLVAGSTIEVFPDGPVGAAELADFLGRRAVTVMFLTTGLFRLVADHRPEAFAAVRQVMAGGEVVPAEHVRSLLVRFPGLRVSNGYGPTENTSLSTIHHIDDVTGIDEPIPIGRPVAGTQLLVLDEHGRMVPPGGVGELATGGAGLAVDYYGDEEQTHRAFVTDPPGAPGRLYRTGDVVRWDARGRLLFLGRRDHQVKVRGHRVELEAVRARLLAHPDVRDAVVVTVGDGPGERRILAGVMPRGGTVVAADLRLFAAEHLPAFAVPSWWAVVPEFPVTANGKIDVAALRKLAMATAQD